MGIGVEVQSTGHGVGGQSSITMGEAHTGTETLLVSNVTALGKRLPAILNQIIHGSAQQFRRHLHAALDHTMDALPQRFR